MQKIAYAFLNLQPHEFWELTLLEYQLMIEGYKLRDEKGWKKMAQMASWITAPHLKRPISPDKLLNFDKKKEKKKTTPEYTKKYLDELESEFEK